MLVSFDDFTNIDLRVGTILEVNDFPAAQKPAYQLLIDFGPIIGIKKSSAQLTTSYTKSSLLGRQIIANINFKPKQIANFISECLVLAAVNDSGVLLLQPEKTTPNGAVIQ
jgi:tRNA-binding protein